MSLALPLPAGERQRFVLCEKCHRETVVKMEQRPEEVVLGCTHCRHVWTVEHHTP